MKQNLIILALTLVAAQAQAITLKVDPASSQVAWTGTKKLGSSHNGNVNVKDGHFDVNDKGDVTGGTIVIDMTTISNEDLKSDPDSQKKLVTHLTSADFFNVSKYPTATFKLKSVKKGEGNSATVKGILTMIGKPKPIEFPATFTASKESLEGDAVVTIKRTEYGLKYNSGSFFKDLAAEKIINDDFTLNVKISAKAEPVLPKVEDKKVDAKKAPNK